MFGKKNQTPAKTGVVVSSEEGLKKALAAVRLVQNYAAVGAEILILVAFAMSSLDVSTGGNLAEISGLAWMWGAVFALGIDTCFILSWVRVRQLAMVVGKRRHLWWAIPLALGMSFIVFQPVAIQQLQQSLHITFEQALNNLGINLGFLVYARSGVAVFLGAVLALTNVENTEKPSENQTVSQSLSQALMTPINESSVITEVRDDNQNENNESLISQLQLPSGTRKDQVRNEMRALRRSGSQINPINPTLISTITGIPYSTVARLVSEIKKEEEFA